MNPVSQVHEIMASNYRPSSDTPALLDMSTAPVGDLWVATLEVKVDTSDLLPDLKKMYSSPACSNSTIAKEKAAESMLEVLRINEEQGLHAVGSREDFIPSWGRKPPPGSRKHSEWTST